MTRRPCWIAFLVLCPAVLGEEPKVPAPAAGTERVLVQAVVYATLKDEDVKRLPPDFDTKAAVAGWRRTRTGFQKITPMGGLVVLCGNSAVTTDANGRAIVPRRTAPDCSPMPLRLRYEGRTFPLKEAGRRGVARVVEYRRSWADCCKGDCEGGDAAIAPAKDDLRCLDYNGWWSDGVNYPMSDWRAYRNFIMSDCDRAIKILRPVFCATDHIFGGCQKVPFHFGHTCSWFILHSETYHKHNFPW